MRVWLSTGSFGYDEPFVVDKSMLAPQHVSRREFAGSKLLLNQWKLHLREGMKPSNTQRLVEH